MITKRSHRSGRRAREAQRHKSFRSSSAQSAQDIRGFARRRNAEKNVAWPTEAKDLPFEDLFITVVITDCGDDGAIGSECDCREWRTIEEEAGEEFAGDVLCVAGTAAVSSNEQLSFRCQSVGYDIGEGEDGILAAIALYDRLEGLQRLIKIVGDEGDAQDEDSSRTEAPNIGKSYEEPLERHPSAGLHWR